ncbi:GTPase-activating protein, partial [Coelomomyces lativittatus]
IRSTSGNSGISGDSLMSKMVVGAQHSFTAPLRSLLSPLATPTDSTKHGGRRKSHARSRDDFVNATKDAWGDLDEHNDSNESLDVSNVQNLTSTPSVEKEEEKHIKDPSKHTLPIENEDDSIVIVEKDDSFSPTTSKRMTKLITVLESGTIDLAQLKKQCWTGIPMHLRPICWQLLIGYLPCSADRRSHVLAKKRKEYMDTVHQYWSNGPTEKSIAHQIHIDILRTFPLPIYSNERVQRSLECILYCWAMQHPACGYVQGINDLLTPFFTVYLGPILNDKKEIDSIPQEDLSNVEADSFWCLTKLIDGIQDNYTTAQPGIQKLVSRLREVIQRVSPKLYEHFKKENVEYIQFAFRWMNCLLMREVSHHLTIRMWDTYLAEGADFSEYHLFTC